MINTTKNIVVMSVMDAFDLTGDFPTSLMISIRNSDAEANDAGDQGFVFTKATFLDTLVIRFDDIDQEISFNGRNLTLFNDNHARKIIEFVMTHQNTAERIFVHCHAGISRSPAVAMFISEEFDFSLGNRKFPLHNKKVFSTLKRVFHEKINN